MTMTMRQAIGIILGDVNERLDRSEVIQGQRTNLKLLWRLNDWSKSLDELTVNETTEEEISMYFSSIEDEKWDNVDFAPDQNEEDSDFDLAEELAREAIAEQKYRRFVRRIRTERAKNRKVRLAIAAGNLDIREFGDQGEERFPDNHWHARKNLRVNHREIKTFDSYGCGHRDVAGKERRRNQSVINEQLLEMVKDVEQTVANNIVKEYDEIDALLSARISNDIKQVRNRITELKRMMMPEGTKHERKQYGSHNAKRRSEIARLKGEINLLYRKLDACGPKIGAIGLNSRMSWQMPDEENPTDMQWIVPTVDREVKLARRKRAKAKRLRGLNIALCQAWHCFELISFFTFEYMEREYNKHHTATIIVPADPWHTLAMRERINLDNCLSLDDMPEGAGLEYFLQP